MNKKLSILKTPTAKSKLKEIYHYTRKQWGVEQAKKYMVILDKAIHDVAKGVKQTRINPEFSTRFSYIRAEKHYIFFEYKEDSLIVVTVFHTAQSVKDRLADEATNISLS